MRRKSCSIMLVCFAVLFLVSVPSVSAASGQQTDNNGKVAFTVLYNFGGEPGDPTYPLGVIAQGRDGNMYSASPYGGTSNDGTVFRITPQGKVTVLSELSSYEGSSGLTLGTDGNFYGAEVYGGNGYGSVFKITPGGKITVLYTFTGQNFDAYPLAPPIQGSDGKLYGTANSNSLSHGGEVYNMTLSGSEVSLFEFNHADGADPADPLVEGTDGNFYGTASDGGNYNCGGYGCGVVFRITPMGHHTVLHDFERNRDDGFYPAAPLIEGSDGRFYGTTPEGGANNGFGTVFSITRTGKFTLLHIFRGDSGGRFPQAPLLQATDGNFYGTTASGAGPTENGVIFKIDSSGKFSVVHAFDGASGAGPWSGLFQHTGGKLYGFTFEGGTYNYGTFYSLDLGLGPFVSLVPTAGRIGKVIGILGQGLTGTSDVSFNGKPSKFSVRSDTFLAAAVPNDATTGFVTVITTGGKLKSNTKFRIIN